MSSLIQINYENEKQTVTGRSLHNFLEVESNYTTWFKRMTEYGFSEGLDFIPFSEESTGGRPSDNHQLTIEMAKEISMLQRTEKGKQARQYFIELEKAWNSPEAIMARALKMADTKIISLQKEKEQLLLEAESNKPKILFADAVSCSSSTILIGDLAKLIKQNGVDIGQKRLFAWLRENGYLIKRHGADYNSPTQMAMDLKLFTIKETAITHSDGHVTVSKTTKVTGKGQTYFVNKFLGKKTA
jgi:anti-repressor protein